MPISPATKWMGFAFEEHLKEGIETILEMPSCCASSVGNDTKYFFSTLTSFPDLRDVHNFSSLDSHIVLAFQTMSLYN